MKLSPLLTALVFFAVLAVFLGVMLVDRLLHGRPSVVFRWVGFSAVFGGFFLALQLLFTDHGMAVDITKAALAVVAALTIFYEAYRVAIFRPVSEKWIKLVSITLGLAAVLTYFNGLKFSYTKYYHRWDQYHYYMGAKYFPELGYDGLYKCAAVAQNQIGLYKGTHPETGRTLVIDMSKEVTHPDKKIRNLGGDNLLKPAAEFLAHPEQCLSLFSPERWDDFKKDVTFFRAVSDKNFWEDMQKDHGFNPPPVWTVAGKFFADLKPAGVGTLQLLAGLDLIYLAAMFGAIYWAFGARVFGLAALLFGCQAPAPFAWTGGAFLRQDWLFYLVFSACLLKKQYFALGAASLVYAALLRIFPGLVVIGWLTIVGFQLYRHRTLTKPQWRMLAGGVIAAAILMAASIRVCGKDSYTQFYEHTLKVHDQTPLTNHMGLRVLVGQSTPIEIAAIGFGKGPDWGRMKYTKNPNLTDPFQVWKDMRNARYTKYRPLAFALIGLFLALFALTVRRMKSMWLAMSLAQLFIVLLSQLTCYYYTFMILGAFVAYIPHLRMRVELTLLGFTILSQVAWRVFYWNDDRYWMLSLLSLVACALPLCWIYPSSQRNAESGPASQ
ncbi:MAG: hypothetical protein IPK82_40930 [Polyangiaceae bacterium]|nr:hypothetical protein [Polyangiaceae bacterium]